MKKILLILSLLTLSTEAFAVPYPCFGKITFLAVAPKDNTVNVSLSPAQGQPASTNLEGALLCKIGTTFNGVGPDTCRLIFQQLLIAKLQDKSVRFYFDDALSCGTQPKWSAGGLGLGAGWYNGPEIF
jgi:hypothetical protein